jgi:hypothetical protein
MAVVALGAQSCRPPPEERLTVGDRMAVFALEARAPWYRPPTALGGGTCENGVAYDFVGTASECGENESSAQSTPGDVALDACERLCPPISDAGALGYVAGLALSSCEIVRGCHFPPCTTMNLICTYDLPNCSATGRRPRGLRSAKDREGLSPTGRFLARMAYLEAASVTAFERLAHELELHGAPRRLHRSALRAARDEVRHARVATSLAKRAGAAVLKPWIRKSRERSLVAMAIENAVEGCVNETFGAAIAMAQSITASDRRVRTTMRQIARDEMQHAALAWRVAKWLDGCLSEAERATVKKARTRAASALLRRASLAIEDELVEGLGLPPPRVARALALDLAAALWMPRLDSAACSERRLE